MKQRKTFPALIKVGQGHYTRRVGTTPMNIQTAKQITRNRTGWLGITSHVDTTEEAKGSISTPPDLPRASSLINDNYCVTMLPGRLLAGSSSVSKQTMNFVKLNVNCHIAKPVHTAPGLSQKKELSPWLVGCYLKENKLKYVKSASCVTQLSCVKPVTNVKNVASNLPVGARLQNFWQTWLDLGAGPKVVQILKEGYTLLFRIWPKLTRSPTVISCYVNPHRNLYLLEALHQLIDKNTVELVQNQTYLGFFNRLFLVPKPTKSGDLY